MEHGSVPAAGRARRNVELGRPLGGLAAVALAVVLWGGYDRGWRWTGFAHNATLWDWLHLLALPLAFTVAPLWLRHRARLDRARTALLGLTALGFCVLVVVGYAFDLGWTGFPGNRLWDWLELLVLPLAIALVPVWAEISKGFRRRHAAALGCVFAALLVTVVGGYSWGWGWTGFQGNTLFDWLQLFVAPLLLPLVVIPLVHAWMEVEPEDAPEPGDVTPAAAVEPLPAEGA